MSAILTDFLVDRLPKHLLGIEALPLPNNIQLALYTSGEGILTDTTTGEVNDVNYVRQPITFDENGLSNPFHFNGLATLQTITHQAILGEIDGVTRILIAIELATPLQPAIGQPMWCEAGSINVTFSI